MKRAVSDHLAAPAPALSPCPACQNPVSSAAKHCPQCGHVFRRKMSGGTRAVLIVAAVAAALLWWSYAAHEAEEDLRKMRRDHAETLDDIRYGRTAPVPVRIVK